MKIDIMTLFPDMCNAFLNESIIGRAKQAGIIDVECTDIRPFTENKHGKTDDYPYGGGMGMVMSAQPIYDCYRSICEKRGDKPHVIYMSPKGKVLTQKRAYELSKTDGFIILCGHYEGVDERILEEIVTDEISIGDYVLTGGELPAMVVIDAVSRLIPGVLAEDSTSEESFSDGMLEYPQYTRPVEFMGRKVPEVLLSGHHANIKKWREEEAYKRTLKKRPELLSKRGEK